MNNVRLPDDKGFTLIEVLVSLTIFAIGLLGLGFYLAQDMKSKVDTQVYPTAMQIANQTIESLNETLKNRDIGVFAQYLARYTDSVSPLEKTGDAISSHIHIKLADNASAVDGNGLSLLNTSSANWKPPYTVNFVVSYVGQNNNMIHFPISYVFVPFAR